MKEKTLGTKLLLAAVTLGVLAYFSIQAVRYFGDPLTTTIAYQYQVEMSTVLSGYVVRDEAILTDDTSGLLQLQRAEGERISDGGVVGAGLRGPGDAGTARRRSNPSIPRSNSCSTRRRRRWGRRSLCDWTPRSSRRSATTGALWRRTGWTRRRTAEPSCGAW